MQPDQAVSSMGVKLMQGRPICHLKLLQIARWRARGDAREYYIYSTLIDFDTSNAGSFKKEKKKKKSTWMGRIYSNQFFHFCRDSTIMHFLLTWQLHYVANQG